VNVLIKVVTPYCSICLTARDSVETPQNAADARYRVVVTS